MTESESWYLLYEQFLKTHIIVDLEMNPSNVTEEPEGIIFAT